MSENEIPQALVNGQRIGVITDVDGTISPIVDIPSQAHVTERSKELLTALHSHLA